MSGPEVPVPARRALPIYIRGHPPHVPLPLLPLNRRFKRGTTVMLQAFRTWRTCSRHQHESPELEIRLKEISAAIEHGRGCPNRMS
jgi:hypothetical protein